MRPPTSSTMLQHLHVAACGRQDPRASQTGQTGTDHKNISVIARHRPQGLRSDAPSWRLGAAIRSHAGSTLTPSARPFVGRPFTATPFATRPRKPTSRCSSPSVPDGRPANHRRTGRRPPNADERRADQKTLGPAPPRHSPSEAMTFVDPKGRLRAGCGRRSSPGPPSK